MGSSIFLEAHGEAKYFVGNKENLPIPTYRCGRDSVMDYATATGVTLRSYPNAFDEPAWIITVSLVASFCFSLAVFKAIIAVNELKRRYYASGKYEFNAGTGVLMIEVVSSFCLMIFSFDPFGFRGGFSYSFSYGISTFAQSISIWSTYFLSSALNRALDESTGKGSRGQKIQDALYVLYNILGLIASVFGTSSSFSEIGLLNAFLLFCFNLYFSVYFTLRRSQVNKIMKSIQPYQGTDDRKKNEMRLKRVAQYAFYSGFFNFLYCLSMIYVFIVIGSGSYVGYFLVTLLAVTLPNLAGLAQVLALVPADSVTTSSSAPKTVQAST